MMTTRLRSGCSHENLIRVLTNIQSIIEPLFGPENQTDDHVVVQNGHLVQESPKIQAQVGDLVQDYPQTEAHGEGLAGGPALDHSRPIEADLYVAEAEDLHEPEVEDLHEAEAILEDHDQDLPLDQDQVDDPSPQFYEGQLVDVIHRPGCGYDKEGGRAIIRRRYVISGKVYYDVQFIVCRKDEKRIRENEILPTPPTPPVESRPTRCVLGRCR